MDEDGDAAEYLDASNVFDPEIVLRGQLRMENSVNGRLGQMERKLDETQGKLMDISLAKKEEPLPLRGRENMRPTRYEGRVSWEQYWLHFSVVVSLNKWNTRVAKDYLIASLDGVALQFASSLPGLDRMDLETLTINMETRFGARRKVSVHRAQLDSIRRKTFLKKLIVATPLTTESGSVGGRVALARLCSYEVHTPNYHKYHNYDHKSRRSHMQKTLSTRESGKRGVRNALARPSPAACCGVDQAKLSQA